MKKIAIVLSLLVLLLISGCTEQNQVAQFQCPELSTVELSNRVMVNSNYDPNQDMLVDTTEELWEIKTIDYATNTEKLMFVNPQENEDGTKTFYCDLGSKHIELGESASKYVPDYVYCGDFIRSIILYKLDASGNIINNNKTSVEIIFDSKTKKYVSTKCGTYSTVNSP